MKKSIATATIAILALASALGLAACGASLDREVEIQGMMMSVPSNWAEHASDENTDDAGVIAYEKFSDDDDAPYTAIVVRYDRITEDSPATAEEAIDRVRQEAEADLGVTGWDIDEEKSEIIDGAQATTYEYSFEKEIDRVRKSYEYKKAYVFAAGTIYEISVYGDEASMADVVGSIEL